MMRFNTVVSERLKNYMKETNELTVPLTDRKKALQNNDEKHDSKTNADDLKNIILKLAKNMNKKKI